MDDNLPSLVDRSVKYNLSQMLHQCHKVKDEYYNVMFNVGMFIAFVCMVASLLFYKYKGRLTPEEAQLKDREKQEYVLSKIKQLQLDKQQTLITGLPQF